MDARLYVIPASHPSIAAELMLDHKGIAYKRTDLLPVISKGVLRAVGFPGITVPALKIDGAQGAGLAGDRPRARPAAARAAALPRRPREAGGGRGGRALRRGGAAARRCARSSGGRSSRTRRRCAATRRAPSSASRSTWRCSPRRRSSPSRRASTRPTTQHVRRDLAALPGMLDKIDGWIAAGSPERRAAKRRRLPDRHQPRPGDDPRGPAPGDRGAARRRAGEARGPGLSGPHAADPPTGLARAPLRDTAAAQAPRASVRPARPAARRPGSASEAARRVPSGSAKPGSSSSSGARTKRRLRHLGVGQGQALGRELEIAEQEQVDVERARAVAGGLEAAGRARPRSPCRRRAAPRAQARCGCELPR